MIDISVIIPVYNAAPLIKRCLDSILAQNGEYTYEVLLIDDGSTDNSVEIIKSYNNPHFKIFRQKNAGPAAARNVGITNAQGKYITFLDADDYWENTFFEETISFLSKNTECVAVSVVCKNITISGICYNPSLYTNCKERCCVKNELRELEYTPFISQAMKKSP
jgi:glycosyltransferase involved in cell wall biosynthesis